MPIRKPSAASVRFRAICFIQAWSGFGVWPAKWTRRVAIVSSLLVDTRSSVRYSDRTGSGAHEVFQPQMRDAMGLVERERNGLHWGGALLVGTKGRMVLTGHNATFSLLPDDQFKG